MKQGGVITLALWSYVYIPSAVLSAISGFHWVYSAFTLAEVVIRAARYEGEAAAILLLEGCWDFLISSIAPVIYVIVAYAIFSAARLRYVLTGDPRVFLNLVGSIVAITRYGGHILTVILYLAIARLATGAALVALSITGFGLPIAIVIGAARIWILAYYTGILAAEVRAAEQETVSN